MKPSGQRCAGNKQEQATMSTEEEEKKGDTGNDETGREGEEWQQLAADNKMCCAIVSWERPSVD